MFAKRSAEIRARHAPLISSRLTNQSRSNDPLHWLAMRGDGVELSSATPTVTDSAGRRQDAGKYCG